MKNLFWIFCLMFTTGIYAQEGGKLAGTIKDNQLLGEGVVYADVQLKKTSYKTQTNFRGNFELKDVAPGAYIVEITYPGYETIEVPVTIKEGEESRISASMSAKTLSFTDMASLQETISENKIDTNADLSTGQKK